MYKLIGQELRDALYNCDGNQNANRETISRIILGPQILILSIKVYDEDLRALSDLINGLRTDKEACRVFFSRIKIPSTKLTIDQHQGRLGGGEGEAGRVGARDPGHPATADQPSHPVGASRCRETDRQTDR